MTPRNYCPYCAKRINGNHCPDCGAVEPDRINPAQMWLASFVTGLGCAAVIIAVFEIVAKN